MITWLRRPRNWRGETSKQELERRVKALEASVQSAHDRINEFDERFAIHTHQVADDWAIKTTARKPS
jgi:hypothetical protein